MKETSTAYRSYIDFFKEVNPDGTPKRASDFKSINALAREINSLRKDQIAKAREDLSKGLDKAVEENEYEDTFTAAISTLTPTASKKTIEQNANVIVDLRELCTFVESQKQQVLDSIKDLEDKESSNVEPTKESKEALTESEDLKKSLLKERSSNIEKAENSLNKNEVPSKEISHEVYYVEDKDLKVKITQVLERLTELDNSLKEQVFQAAKTETPVSRLYELENYRAPEVEEEHLDEDLLNQLLDKSEASMKDTLPVRDIESPQEEIGPTKDRFSYRPPDGPVTNVS